MPKVTFVKSARKDNPVAKKGESYYWWAFMQGGRGGPKRYSKERPKQSQLTQSDFWGAVYSLQEANEKPPHFDDLESKIEEIKSDLGSIRDDTQDKYDNLPTGLQEGSSGELLQERIDAIENVINEMDGFDLSIEYGDAPEGETEDQKDAREEEMRENRAGEIWDEVTSTLGDIGCS